MGNISMKLGNKVDSFIRQFADEGLDMISGDRVNVLSRS